MQLDGNISDLNPFSHSAFIMLAVKKKNPDFVHILTENGSSSKSYELQIQWVN